MDAEELNAALEARMADRKLEPVGDRVAVEPVGPEEETTESGLYIPDTAKEEPARGVVIAVGPGPMLEDGSRGEMQLEVGDEVVYTKYAPAEIEVNERPVMLMRESNVLTVLR